jgi:hypothetical protein
VTVIRYGIVERKWAKTIMVLLDVEAELGHEMRSRVHLKVESLILNEVTSLLLLSTCMLHTNRKSSVSKLSRGSGGILVRAESSAMG